MSPEFERVVRLASLGLWPWSIAVIYLIAGILRSIRSKAKPELVLVGLSFIVIVAVGALVHSSSSGTATNVRAGDITQQGNQNAAGVGGSVTQTSQPCDDSSTVKK